MATLENAIDRIKTLECPTGEVEIRVADILEDYEIANRNFITIYRDEQFDINGAEAYKARITNNSRQSVIVLAESGLDNYVAKVVDAYILN